LSSSVPATEVPPNFITTIPSVRAALKASENR
jgi:hypothetical protein